MTSKTAALGSKPRGVTYTNLFVLRSTFATSDRVSNRIPRADYPHLRRCMEAGLMDLEGNEMILTAAGRVALHRN